MLRSWITRSVFIVLLSACIAGWVCTRASGVLLAYNIAGRTWILHLAQGRVMAKKFPANSDMGWRNGIHVGISPNDNAHWSGFYFGKDSAGLPTTSIPFWFISAILSLSLLCLWQKTRPLPKAFPIEANPAA